MDEGWIYGYHRWEGRKAERGPQARKTNGSEKEE